MERQRGELVPVGEVIADLPDTLFSYARSERR